MLDEISLHTIKYTDFWNLSNEMDRHCEQIYTLNVGVVIEVIVPRGSI